MTQPVWVCQVVSRMRLPGRYRRAAGTETPYGPEPEVPGAAVQDRAEHAGGVRPRHAQPLHRTRRGDQAGVLAVGQEPVVRDRRERIAQRTARDIRHRGSDGERWRRPRPRCLSSVLGVLMGNIIDRRYRRRPLVQDVVVDRLRRRGCANVGDHALRRSYHVCDCPALLVWWIRWSGFLSWWDGVELWLSGLGFVAQTLVVMPVVLALAYGTAVLLDGALGNGIRVFAGYGGAARDARPGRRSAVSVTCRDPGSRWCWSSLVVLVVVMWLITR